MQLACGRYQPTHVLDPVGNDPTEPIAYLLIIAKTGDQDEQNSSLIDLGDQATRQPGEAVQPPPEDELGGGDVCSVEETRLKFSAPNAPTARQLRGRDAYRSRKF